MAGQYKTLGEVRNQAIFRGDLEGLLDRHPTLNANQEANDAYRRLRVKLANNDVQTVLAPTAILSLPTTEAIAGGGYAEIDWPTGAVSVHGLDVKVGGYWTTVPQGTFTQRRLGPVTSDRGDYQYADEGLAMWIQRSLPTVSGSNPVAGKIMLFPVPSGGSYVLWSLPEWVDITLDSDVFPGQESWLQWVIYELTCVLLVRDIGPNTTAQLQEMQVQRERVWADIKTNAQRLAQDGPIQPVSRYGSARGRGARLIP